MVTAAMKLKDASSLEVKLLTKVHIVKAMVFPVQFSSVIFVGRIDAKAPILWPPDVKSDSFEKTLMLLRATHSKRP